MQELRYLNEHATIDASEPLVMDYCWKGSNDGRVNINVFNHTGEFGIGTPTPAVDSTVNTIGYVGKPSEAPVGKKYDAGKPRYSLLPPNALEEVAKVLTYGSQKYEDHNWLNVDKAEDRFFSAANRHMWAWKKGEKLDEENQCNHLAAAIASLMFILELELIDGKRTST